MYINSQQTLLIVPFIVIFIKDQLLQYNFILDTNLMFMVI
jgi:hypothetical protein